MTVEAFVPTPPALIDGTGPYPVLHPYKAGALMLEVVQDGTYTLLEAGDWTADPPEAEDDGGAVTLSGPAATTYAGGTLYITRGTQVEQGWQGTANSREKGLEAALDWSVQGIQDAGRARQSGLRALGVSGPAGVPVIFEPDRVLIGATGGGGIVPGPDLSDIDTLVQISADAGAVLAELSVFLARSVAVAALDGLSGATNRIGWLDEFGRARYVVRSQGAMWIPDMPGWVPDGDYSPVSVFGGRRYRSMGDIDVETGVDSTAAIKAARAYAVANDKICLVDGYYKYVGPFVPDPEEKIEGIGRRRCGIQIWSSNTQTGLQIINDNCTVTGLELQSYLYEAKEPGGGTGAIGNCLIIGNFGDGQTPEPRGYYVDDVLLTRKDNEPGYTSYNSYALQVSGGANAGYFGVVYIDGRHSGPIVAHWTGDFTSVGDPVTETVHPRNFTMGKVIVTGDSIGTLLTLSAVANLTIGSLVSDRCRQVLKLLPGDELDDFNAGQMNVGASIRIDEIVCNDMTTVGITGDNDDALDLATVGTSKFRTEEGEPRKEQMRVDLSIGALTLHTDDPALLYAIDLFEYFGSFVVDHARITGFADAFRSRYSRGRIEVNFDFTDGRCEILDSDTVLTGAWDGGDPTGNIKHAGNLDQSRSVGVTSTYWSLAASDITRGDTSVTVPTGITQDIPRGAVVEITGTTNGSEQTLRFVADSFTESGLTVVELGVYLPHDMTGVTLAYNGDCNVVVDATQMCGARSGVLVDGGNVDVRGNIYAGRFNVHSVNEKSVVTYSISSPVSGIARELSETYTVYDLWFQDGGTATVTGVVGAAKVGDHGAYYSLGAAGTPSAKVHLKDARVLDPAKVIAVPEPQIDLTVSGSFTDAGAEYTILDALGLERTGSDANGYFRRDLDGTMECWVCNTDVGATQPFTWTFPGGGFVDTASTCVHVTPGNPTEPRMGHGYAISATQAQVWVHNHDGTDAPSTGANLSAKGRWKT